MDPTATLRALLEACIDGDRQAAYDSCMDLAEWINRDGYLPLVHRYSHEVIGDIYRVHV
jgi:hypothetical protein